MSGFCTTVNDLGRKESKRQTLNLTFLVFFFVLVLFLFFSKRRESAEGRRPEFLLL